MRHLETTTLIQENVQLRCHVGGLCSKTICHFAKHIHSLRVTAILVETVQVHERIRGSQDTHA
jgi:hypothetical protein